MYFHYLWVGPLQCVVAAIYLWYRLGPAVMAALSVMFLLMPAQFFSAKLFSRLRRKTAALTDKRVKVMNEVIAGIRVIKLYCWEKLFGQRVEMLRRQETRQLQQTRRVEAWVLGSYFATSQLSMFFFILALVFSGRDDTIRPGTVFLLMGIVQYLRLVCGRFVPFASNYVADILVVINRIQTFLLLKELTKLTDQQPANRETENSKSGANGEEESSYAVEVTNLTANWEGNSTVSNTLGNVTLTVKPGWLLTVIGPVGSGKDLSILPDGDLTFIGDRGITLSGGQRARVSLARALYQDADVYLLDDPLAAMDTTVGKYVFNKCIMQYLRNKSRVLVTHKVQLLPAADSIVIFNDITSQGKYAELAKCGVVFSELLKPPSNESTTHAETTETNWSSQESVEDQEEITSSILCDDTRLSRSDSSASIDGMEVDHGAGSDQVLKEEKKETGNIDRQVFISYFRAGASRVRLILLVLFLLLAQVFLVTSDWWLAKWTNQVEDGHTALDSTCDTCFDGDNMTTTVSSEVTTGNTHIADVNNYFNLYVYASIILAMLVCSLTRAFLFFEMALSAGENLHNKMFACILRATMNFFDTNPVGRVLNRFSKDTGQVDDILPRLMFDLLQIILQVISIVIVTSTLNPWSFLLVLPLVAIFLLVRRYYVQTSRSVKRLEGTTRSPVFSHLSATLQGLHTIRAMHMEQRLTAEFDAHQDLHTEAWFLYLTTSRWLGIRIDFVSVVFIASVVYSALFAADTLNAGFVGLSVVYSVKLMGISQFLIRQTVELENQMISVERVLQYTRLPIEADLESKPGQKPPDTWPSSGSLQAKEVSLRYSPSAPSVLKDINFHIQGGEKVSDNVLFRQSTPLVLKDINFDIHGKEKIGIVGRTGAGKSSLITALFRLVESEGEITIDGVSIHSLGLHDLRKVISIIPQDPVLFTGSVRRNLDPFDEYSDSQLWGALEEVQLKEAITNNPDNLYMEVTEGGSNFSAGQRQLMCLARAVLGNTRILMIDEATANVDPITDELIQQTIRNKFRECTVLTIAHRLHTIIDSDRIMVLNAGRIVEMGTPTDLLSKGEEGTFYSMVKQLGKSEQENLTEIATNRQRDHKCLMLRSQGACTE
ncbi:multidrug resistance-associated protein 4 [Elysia marginata]|uniref:Multidrug resistance-associated protein 4 n=1 Tax=Elysia marginata TaxID=1093978 RepID=A0AAV4JZU7_9GAST|nr:multidrug resistance-associated protein 4 [Elysia marginata]